MHLLAKAGAAAAIAALAGGAPVAAQEDGRRSCAGLLFSTSEDFLAQVRVPGGPVISDGDLLSYEMGTARLCRRNAEILRPFGVREFDLGLDAIFALRSEEGEIALMAFSTELDSLRPGQFTAGDLLLSNGAVIPNAALLAPFDLPRELDLGLDAVHLRGDPDAIRRFAEEARGIPREEFLDQPEILRRLLGEFGVDILFSTEGTSPQVQQPRFIDGDLLSATGGIARAHADLFAILPAGIPERGVDYGLDAYSPGVDPIELVPVELISAEIDNLGREPFTDGDLLQAGHAVYLPNFGLLQTLEPRARDLGLDAVHDGPREVTCIGRVEITEISGRPTQDLGGGISWLNASGFALDTTTGLFALPFTNWIEIQGIVPRVICPNIEDIEYRVEFRHADSGGWQPIVFTSADGWRRRLAPICALSPTPYTSDGDGWFSVAEYRENEFCPDFHGLAYWNAAGRPDASTVEFRLTVRDTSAGVSATSAAVTAVIDSDSIVRNDADLAAGDLSLVLYRPTPTEADPEACEPYDDQCRIQGEGEDIVIKVRGHVFDTHFRDYRLCWGGGGLPGCYTTGFDIPTDSYHDPSGRPELGDTGTLPLAARDAYLGTVNLTTAYAAVAGSLGLPTELPEICGYYVELSATDRPIIGSFVAGANSFSTTNRGRTRATVAFCAEP